jgi:hypothetical protein
LAGAAADVATDILPVVDMDAPAGSKNKKMTFEELAKAIAPRLKITWDGAITVEEA